MNVMLDDGTVRCADCFDRSTYASLTDLPCLYCGKTTQDVRPCAMCDLPPHDGPCDWMGPQPSSDDQEWEEAVGALVVDTPVRTLIIAKGKDCSWCPESATWKIVDPVSAPNYDLACTEHGQEWYPELFPTANVTVG